MTDTGYNPGAAEDPDTKPDPEEETPEVQVPEVEVFPAPEEPEQDA